MRVKEICQRWTPGYQLPRKGVIVYAGASDWFRGKIDSLYQGRKTLYRAKFWNLQREIHIAGLENMAARQRSR